MSGGRRKHNSKWDLKEEESSHEKEWDTARTGKAGKSYYERESRSGRFSPRAAGYNNAHKWSAKDADDIQSSRHELQFPSRELLTGSRGTRKDDRIDDYRENFRATNSWHGDENYDMKIAPGLEDWRLQIRRRSPRNDWNGNCRTRSRSRSRSHSHSDSHSLNRSRSPVHELRRDAGVFGRNRGRPGISAQICKDFSAGRCRRGSHCHFSHHSSHNYEDNRDSRHKQAGAPKYSTPHESREYPMRSGRNREGSLERGGEHESRKSGVPCKFFAAGNCRNGKYCRFSHSGQGLASPNRRSWDDSLVRGHNSDDMEKSWSGPKWSDTATYSDVAKLSEDKNEKVVNRKSRDDRLARKHNSDDVKKSWDGSTLNDAENASMLSENQNAGVGSPGPRFAAWSADDRFPHTLDDTTAHAKIIAVTHRGGENDKMEALLSNMNNARADMGAPATGGTENWLGDMEMSPEWNYPVKPSSHAINEDHGHITQSSQSVPSSDTSLPREQGIVPKASGLLHDAAANVEPMRMDKTYLKRDTTRMDGGVRVSGADKITGGGMAIPHVDLNFSANIMPTQTFDQNSQSSSNLPFSSLNFIGQSLGAMTSEPSKAGNLSHPQNLTGFQVDRSISKPGNGDGNALHFDSADQPAQNVVSREQLTQLTNLSASLVELLEKGQQLPHLYAALNSHNVVQVPSSANSERLTVPNPVLTSQQNDVIKSQNQYDPLSDSIEPRKHEVVNPSEFSVNPGIGKANDGLENCKLSEISVLEAEADKKAQVQTKNLQENGEAQKDGDDKDDKADEGKKSKDIKGSRAFKFALAEFVKELLKPTWKEGQINKDIYKNIVKKVVDKVIGTMQGTATIPQTQEKIEQYLSFSKSKLTKLVQAYVDKLRKG